MEKLRSCRTSLRTSRHPLPSEWGILAVRQGLSTVANGLGQKQAWRMTPIPVPPSTPTARDPWFRRHPGLALTVVGALYAAVLSLRLLHGTPVDAYSMLYALPVALVAATAGLRAGTVAGLVAVGLTVLWVVLQDISLTPTGWASRVLLLLLLLGALLGHATDRQRQAEIEHRRLEAAALLHREAIEINDSLVQGMAATKWSLNTGQVETGKQILDQTIVQAHELVSGLIRRAGMGASTEPCPHAHSRPATSDHWRGEPQEQREGRGPARATPPL